MSAELLKLASEIRGKGYGVGAYLVKELSDSLSRIGLIPDSLDEGKQLFFIEQLNLSFGEVTNILISRFGKERKIIAKTLGVSESLMSKSLSGRTKNLKKSFVLGLVEELGLEGTAASKYVELAGYSPEILNE